MVLAFGASKGSEHKLMSLALFYLGLRCRPRGKWTCLKVFPGLGFDHFLSAPLVQVQVNWSECW